MRVFITAVCLAAVCSAGSLRATEPAAGAIFADGAKLELLHKRTAKLTSGLTEGPAVAMDGTIYFTDIPFGPTEQGMILRYHPATGKITTFTAASSKSNGLQFDREGFLISCDGADGGGRRLIRWNVADGSSETIVDRIGGKRFNAPNDLAIDAKGRIYFTDPRYSGHEPRELEHRAIYRRDPDGSILEVTHDVEKPNGITLSPDGRTMYVGDHNNGSDGLPGEEKPAGPGAMKVYAFPLNADGKVHGERRTLVDFGTQAGCDGITVDINGNIYLTCRSLQKPGVMVINPQGKELAFLPTGPTDQSGEFEDWRGIPSNVEFGVGDDRHTLYVTIDKSLYRITTVTEGFHHVLQGR
jgi:gluconolactonase